LSLEEIEAVRNGGAGPEEALVAAWNLGALPYALTIADLSPHRLAAQLVNNPARAVTGHSWSGRASCFISDPEQYEAINFHDDDIEDAGWAADFHWRVPEGLKSGVYAARLRSGDEEDYLPVFVRPKAPTAPILFLAPSFTYQAYANERFHAHRYVDWSEGSDHEAKLSRQDAYTASHPELGCSLYDLHRDGGVCTSSSRLRPVLNFRPKLTSYWNGAGRHFGADMYLIDWLDREGFQHDIVTDEDLHIEGLDLLAAYRVVLTGSHPEYFSQAMRDALDAYLASGGRLMYLGGNGCWWVTSVDPLRSHVIEVRKSSPWGVPGIVVDPGEHYHSTTGELGGGWRARSLGPESLFGVGYTSEGFCQARPYRRQPGSFDPSMAFIFEGIGEKEVIGDFGLGMGGAAGDEFDRVFPLGSPPDTLILASSWDHSHICLNYSFPYMPKEEKAASVRADMTYYRTSGDGEVFSVGSMCWCTSLPHNGYKNNVARITGNVLRRFMESGRRR
jgi:N,N-dimethylformamidase